MVDRLVLRERLELAGGHAQHGAALQQLPDAEVVALRERFHLLPRAVEDDVDLGRAGADVIREVGAEPRLVGRRGGGRGEDRDGERHEKIGGRLTWTWTSFRDSRRLGE